MKACASILTLLLVLAGCGGRHLPAPIARIALAQLPRFDHVVLIVEENQNYANVIGNTADMRYLNTLAAKYGLATNYFANTHPSINNYFLLTAGQIGISAPWIFRDASDLYPFTIPGENIASILSDNGKTWKSYAEDLPARGYMGRDRWPYVKRHNPFAYFATVRASSLQRKNLVPFEEFARDLRNDSLPNYAFIAPNVYNDGHHDPITKKKAPCGDHRALQHADGWLQTNISPLLESDTFQRSGLLIILFDEACEYGETGDCRFDPKNPKIRGGGQVAALVISSRTAQGTRSDRLYHHESVLRLSLRALGVEHLPGLAADSPDMDDLFRKE